MKQNPQTKEFFLFLFFFPTVLRILSLQLAHGFPSVIHLVTGGLSAGILSTYLPIDLALDKEAVTRVAFRYRVSKSRCTGGRVHRCSHKVKVYLS